MQKIIEHSVSGKPYIYNGPLSSSGNNIKPEGKNVTSKTEHNEDDLEPRLKKSRTESEDELKVFFTLIPALNCFTNRFLRSVCFVKLSISRKTALAQEVGGSLRKK